MSEPLDPEVVRGFLAVVVRCLRTTVGIEAVVAAAGASGARSPPTIAVALDLRGDVRGPVTWVFPPAVALELVRRLLDDPDPGPETLADGATELANILTGRASEVLQAYGLRCEIGAPRMHVGPLPTGLMTRIVTPDGPIDVVLSLSGSC